MTPKIAVVARKVPRPTDLYGGLLYDMRLDPSALQRHLDAGNSIDKVVPPTQGRTLLYRACCPDIEDLLSLKGSEALVKQLLQAGADPNSRNHCELLEGWSEGWTPLMSTSSPEVAELLLDNGADITREADDGMIAIIAACASGKLAVVKILLKRGALEQLERVSKSNHTALSAAVNNQHEDVALLLLRHLVSQGFDINHPRLASNQPLLCCAAGTGQCRVVEFALKLGADPNITGVNGPPVILAVRHGQLSIASCCVRGGLTCRRASGNGRTACMQLH
jgi:ankyrin repeat protein